MKREGLFVLETTHVIMFKVMLLVKFPSHCLGLLCPQFACFAEWMHKWGKQVEQMFSICGVPYKISCFCCTYTVCIKSFFSNSDWILLNMMFHALMGRFQLESFIFIANFSTYVRKYKLLPSSLNQDQQPRSNKKEVSKPNNWNNQWFKLQLSTAQARRQKKLQDLLKMSR